MLKMTLKETNGNVTVLPISSFHLADGEFEIVTKGDVKVTIPIDKVWELDIE